MNSVENRNHLDYVDGLRALCALFVVFHHAYQDVFTIGGPTHTIGGMGSALNPFAYGHLAVGIFIVISGFCLTLPGGANLTLRKSVAEFYASRAWRILPPLFAAILLGLLVNLVIRNHAPSSNLQAIPANLLLLQDVLPHFNILNGPAWSVALEFKIYLVFPLLLILYKRYNEFVVLLATGAVAFAIAVAFKTAKSNFNLTDFCPWFLMLFSMGMWAAKQSLSGTSSRRLGYLWLLGGALAFIVLLASYPITRDNDFRFNEGVPFLDVAIGIFTAAAIYLIYAPRGGFGRTVRRLLSAPPLVWMGKRSYSLYLVHFPLLLAVRAAFPARLFPRSLESIGPAAAIFFIGVAASILFAVVFYWQVESHFLKLPPRLRKRFARGGGLSKVSASV